jgi:hypothetical protein
MPTVTVPPGTTVFGSRVGSTVESSAGVLVTAGREVGDGSGKWVAVAVEGTGVDRPQAVRHKTIAQTRSEKAFELFMSGRILLVGSLWIIVVGPTRTNASPGGQAGATELKNIIETRPVKV